MKAAPVALSVIVPAFNEEALLQGCILSLHATLVTLGLEAEIIIVNDGSRDDTPGICTRLAHDLPRVVAIHQENQGIGGAFRSGLARATGTYVILWPADMEAAPADLTPYVARFGQADVIVGVRRTRVGYNPLMHCNAWLYPKLVRLLFGLSLRDVNWIHAYRRDLLTRVRLTQRGIPMLVEALVRLRDLGATFAEVDVEMKPRLGGRASAARPKIMWHTLTRLLSFWVRWRQERRLQP
jgi:glycosyltransferase involved in cell wall biosynthesis